MNRILDILLTVVLLLSLFVFVVCSVTLVQWLATPPRTAERLAKLWDYKPLGQHTTPDGDTYWTWSEVDTKRVVVQFVLWYAGSGLIAFLCGYRLGRKWWRPRKGTTAGSIAAH